MVVISWCFCHDFYGFGRFLCCDFSCSSWMNVQLCSVGASAGILLQHQAPFAALGGWRPLKDLASSNAGTLTRTPGMCKGGFGCK